VYTEMEVIEPLTEEDFHKILEEQDGYTNEGKPFSMLMLEQMLGEGTVGLVFF
jgi:hypothetical protein